MNNAAPFPSSITGVEFGFLTRDEIRALSVVRIRHTEAIDQGMGFPIPGGLYDQLMGTRGDYQCTTCHLAHMCQGHAGHIELPVPVYHPIFLDQLMKMLNGQCGICFKLKMDRVELHRYTCKLKLLRYGLAKEAHEIDLITTAKRKSKGQPNGIHEDSSSDEVEGDVEDLQNLIVQRRNQFLNKVLRKQGRKKQVLTFAEQKVQSLAEERRILIKDFFANISKNVKCSSCQGSSSRYRKDGFNKIFKQPLSSKGKANNVQLGLRETEPLMIHARKREAAATKRRKQRELESDEGIAMEMDDFSAESGGEGEQLADDTAMGNDSMLDSVAVVGARKTQGAVEEPAGQEYITPAMVYARTEELFKEEYEILNLVYHSRLQSTRKASLSPDMFFIHDVLVTPNKYRPDMKTGAGAITEADQNTLYRNILAGCMKYHEVSRNCRDSEPGSLAWGRAVSALQQSWIALQDAVNSLIDSDKNLTGLRGMARMSEGVKQKLEKKEGLFRMNMMGKRVNFAARSVISPDPNIETNEIGVPPVFAKKLTYPEPVTNHNFYELKEAVLNGPEKWPGAAAVENEDGRLINLKFKNFEERQALANQLLAPSNTNISNARNKKVHRHLNNGDIVIMNRQPTLHKPSMMCHRARVLPGEKTIRMHYANCNTYNADFDGDEMNMHFPQNESARAEAVLIADTDHQYLSGTAGKPLRGLIQDHLSMGVWLSNKDSFFDRADYYQLLYSCLRPENGQTSCENIMTMAPAVLKPKPLWTGKQLVSTVLRNIQPPTYPGLTLTGKSQVTGDRWVTDGKKDNLPTEAEVIFQDGELLCGILDKGQLGPAKGGFIHSVYETYGHTIAGRLLSILGRMLTKLEHMRAFSCGMADIVFTKAGNERRKEELRKAETIGHEVATKYVSLESSVQRRDPELKTRLEDVLRDDNKQAGLDTVFNSRTKDLSSAITKACLPFGLFRDFPKNQMQAMTTSGAKGSAVNANLISCNLGQQVLEGRRTPTMVSGKTLPAFKPFETSVRAGGYITNRFLTGVQPQEYYFHTMAGREGLIDTAVKTSRSGYLQRCIIKGMEGLQVQYDTTVRDSDGTMVQFLYGEDGLDITKQTNLNNFKFQAENFRSLVAEMNLSDEISGMFNDEVAEANEKAIRKVRKSGDLAATDPVTATHNPSSVWGSTSEKFAVGLRTYMKDNPQKLIKHKKTNPTGLLHKKQFEMLMTMKYLRSVIEPGEPVGIVAGQSIGEPSTQMTLNTFHLAGHSAKNVTLGIPRLREIVMTASAQIATPTMTLYLDGDTSEEEGHKFAKGISKLTLAEVVDDVEVKERVGKSVGYARGKIYDIRLNFFPREEYEETYAVTEEDVARSVELKFVPALQKAIKKEMKDKGLAQSGKSKAQPQVGKSIGRSDVVSEVGTVGATSNDKGDPDEKGEKEQARTDDIESEESDMDDDALEEKANRGGDTYNGDEDDNAIAAAARDDSIEPDERSPPHEDEGYGGSPQPKPNETESEDDDERDVLAVHRKVSKQLAKYRAERLLSKDNSVCGFRWDTEGGAWCEITLEYDVKTAKILMLHLVESACRTAVIQHIAGIGAATLAKERVRDDATNTESEIAVVLTEGVNLIAMQEQQHIINPHRIFTNDIVAMLNTYGVEAGRATIIREMSAVFEGHHISVDNRHLNLIADYMTRNGGFLAFSRTGMKSGVSPFAKMSFETTVGFLKDAVLDGDWDDLKGPSARIVTGRPGKIGTGAFDVLAQVA